MTERPDAVVIGGGVIGLAIAWQAAARGLRIAVVDPDPGTGASWAAAGMLAPVSEAHFGEEALIRLNLAAARGYPDFIERLEAETGMECAYRRSGTLAVGLDADDLRVLDDLAQFQRSLGLDVERLSGRECRSLEPMLAPGLRGGVHVASDHQVDNRRLVGALRAAVSERATLRSGRVSRVLVSAGRVRGVGLEDGDELHAPWVVLAAGWRSGDIDGIPERLRPPVRPVKGQILRLRVPARAPLLKRTLRWLAQGSVGYLVPRADGEVVLGATSEERGHDTEVTAGAVHDLLRDAHRLVPAVAEAVLAECRAGLRPGSPDNAPILGETELPGLVVATGHHRNGILLTPVTAHGVAALLAGEEPDPLLAPFSPLRFSAAVSVAP
jgi:glycine oxidase